MAKTSSFRTVKKNKDELTSLWGSTSKGAEKAVEAYVNVRARVLEDLKGIFTRNEFTLLVDIQNGTMFEPSWAANVDTWRANIEDAIKFNQADARWDVDSAQLFEKIDEMHEVYVYFFREEIDRFWQDDDRDLGDFLTIYAK